MRRDLIAVALGLATLLLLIPTAFAAQAPTTEDFVKTVAISDMFEVQSGQLAAEKAQNGDVKSFGQEMIDDHSKTSDALKELIKNKEIKAEVPASVDEEHQIKLDKLKGLSGNQFDKTFVPMQVKAHEKAVSLFEAYAAAGDNDDLKSWAKDTLPTLEEHLEEAKDLNTKVDQMAATEERNKSDDETTRDVVTAEEAKPKPLQKSKIKYITRQTPTDWTAEALIGRTVENANGDNLGEINNVIINEKGDVVAVVIGVGGFLGIGEKNVGVPFEELDFRTAEAMKEKTEEPTTKEEKAQQKTDSAAARFDTEHQDIRIVLNTTKEDLEAAPAFAWLDEQQRSDDVQNQPSGRETPRDKQPPAEETAPSPLPQ